MPAGAALLQTIRSHDQYNTTIYGLNDRYRGIHAGRRVILVNPDDLSGLGVANGDTVDLLGIAQDGVERRANRFRVVSYPTSRGCVAAYYPEMQPARAARQRRARERDPGIEVGDRAARAARPGVSRIGSTGR